MNIQDIAKLAQVSPSTVSKVINGKDKEISEETRKKVLKIVKEYNYVPYFKFLEKDGLKKQLIGLIVQRNNRDRENLVLSVEKAAKKAGYRMIVCFADNEDEISDCVKGLIQKKVSGLLIDSKRWIPCDGWESKTIYISQTKVVDERQPVTFYYRLSEAGELAAEYLLNAGHRTIGCIFTKADRSIADGYKAMLRKENLQVQPILIYESELLEEIERYGISQCLSQNATALICGSQEIACCVCRFLERTNTLIPKDISLIVIGQDNLTEMLGYDITVVRFPTEQMYVEASEYLLDVIENPQKMGRVRKFLPVLIERGSVARPAQEKQGEKLVVVGSMNMDVTIEVATIPIKGMTQIAGRVRVSPGGKGANQAVGAGRLGGDVYMIGCLGNDMDGKQLYTSLVESHVHTDGVMFDSNLPSGKAYINVDKEGENTIVVYPGANQNLDEKQIREFRHVFNNAKYCLLSLEIPIKTAEYTIKFCNRNHIAIILKPSGADTMKEELLSGIDFFIPNEKELHKIVAGTGSVEEKAGILLQRGVKNVIVTLGKKGCYFKNDEKEITFSSADFQAVDTTGGADSFISALAVYLSEGKNIEQSIQFATYAAGITVTRYGVQPALPDRQNLNIYEDDINAGTTTRSS